MSPPLISRSLVAAIWRRLYLSLSLSLFLSLRYKEYAQCEFPVIYPVYILISNTTSNLLKNPYGHFHIMSHKLAET